MSTTEGAPLLRRGILGWFAPAPAAAEIHSDPAEVRAGYSHWQPRILAASTAGYAIFYFVRVNIPLAMPALERDLHISKTDLGWFLTLHGVVYGVSKFLNGFLGDRANARTFMATGLLLSALANFAFGSVSLTVLMGVFWILNGWFQGMGFPPCAKLLTHWFPPRQLATKMSIWNISHQLGGSIVTILCGYLVVKFGWRSCFIVPAIIAVIASLYLLVFLRDTPESLGLPPVENLDLSPPAFPVVTAAQESSQPPMAALPPEPELPYSQILRLYVFSNPFIWLVSIANFFVYTIRYAILSWAPTFLSQEKHVQLTHAGYMTAGFEFAGLLGALAAGWITDRYFAGRASRAAVFFMAICAICLLLFWRIPNPSESMSTTLMALIGFFVYGPQCLVGIAAAKLATKRAAAAAVGLTGLFGYASTTLSGVGMGYLVDHYGWPAGFISLIFIAVAGTLVFAASWPAPAVGNEHAPA